MPELIRSYLAIRIYVIHLYCSRVLLDIHSDMSTAAHYFNFLILVLYFVVLRAAQGTFVLKVAVFWGVAPYSLVVINRCFRRAYCLHHQVNTTDGDNKLL